MTKDDIKTLKGMGTSLFAYNVFSYSANALHTFGIFPALFCGVLTQLFGPEFFYQYLLLVGIVLARVGFVFWCDERDGFYEACKPPNDANFTSLPLEERMDLFDPGCYLVSTTNISIIP